MSTSFIAMIILYWFFLVGVVFLAGSYASRLIITGPSGADVCVPLGKQRCLGETAARNTVYVALFALLANALHLFFHISIMTETPLHEVSEIIWPFLTKTKYGRFTLFRTLFLSALTIISFVTIVRDSHLVKTMGLFFSLSLLIVMSMSGHQGAEGYWNVPFFLDVLHLIAVSLWIGGLFLLRLCFNFFLKGAGMELLETFQRMFRRFSDLATYCVAAVAVTGALLSLSSIKSVSILFGKQYGIVLVFKILLVGVILILGGINKFFIVPMICRADRDRWDEILAARRRLNLLITTEAFLSTCVLFATSMLTHLSPEG